MKKIQRFVDKNVGILGPPTKDKGKVENPRKENTATAELFFSAFVRIRILSFRIRHIACIQQFSTKPLL